MGSSQIMSLPSFEHEVEIMSENSELPPILPRFFVTRMADTPQNPIMDTLSRLQSSRMRLLPTEVQIIIEEQTETTTKQAEVIELSSVWDHVEPKTARIRKNQIKSWDQLHPISVATPASSSLLSEQDSMAFAAARYHTIPRLYDGVTDTLYLKQEDLLANLRRTSIGTSSSLHIWDSQLETFVHNGIEKGRLRNLTVDAKDEIITESLMQVFLTIGTLLRRLEVLLEHLRTRPPLEGSAMHAFAYGLSVILSTIREGLFDPPYSNAGSKTSDSFLNVISYYRSYEELLITLAELCGRELSRTPDRYHEIDFCAPSLLSKIYRHLEAHIEHGSPKLIRATLAFLLYVTSRDYFHSVCASVGFGIGFNTGSEPSMPDADEILDKKLNRQMSRGMGSVSFATFPHFFPSQLKDIMPVARRSFALLKAAQPDHELLKTAKSQPAVSWFWTREPGTLEPTTGDLGVSRKTSDETNQGPSLEDDIDVKDPFHFKVFDEHPGSQIRHPLINANHSKSANLQLQLFIKNFPDTLSCLMPTLSHLTEEAFRPLLHYAVELSKTLLSLFLSPSAPITFQSQLDLLRAYLLLGSNQFRYRLEAALFSDASDYYWTDLGSTIHQRQPWPVGLAPILLMHGWPPVGSDLSFQLRTIIVDSFEMDLSGSTGKDMRSTLIEDRENRLGFAIRDFTKEDLGGKWQNPLYLEAFDFLYMDYKPPHPLDILITASILSKYQRVFTFLLRILRVKNALVTAFRIIRDPESHLFPSHTESSRHLHHFLFLLQVFFSSLSGYIFDTAIGANLSVFSARLAPNTAHFSDIQSLATAHSAVMNDVLSACLLKNDQKEAGKFLHDCLQLTLSFTQLTSELRRGRITENEGATLLSQQHAEFRSKRAELVKKIHNMIENPPTFLPGGRTVGSNSLPNPLGVNALSDLLVRLELDSTRISPIRVSS